MNEHPVDRDLETARTVRNWLEHTADELPDNPTGRERLLDQVDRASQRSARWLPPVFPGGVGTLFSAARLAAAAGIVIIFAGLLLASFWPRDEAAVVAPGTETASPSPSLLTTAAPVLNSSISGRFTGAIDWGLPDDQTYQAPVSRWEGDVYTLRDEYHVRQIEWNDARLPAKMHVWLNRDEYVRDPASPSQRGGVTRARVRLDGDTGAWVGEVEGVWPEDERYTTEWFTLTGSGAYEGLYAVLVASHWYDTDTFQFPNEIAGLIAEGEPPPISQIPADMLAESVPASGDSATEQAEGMGAGTAVRGTLLDASHEQSAQTSEWQGDVLEWRDRVTTFTYDWSDDRLPSRIEARLDGNEYVLQGSSASERGGYFLGTAVGHGPEGSWVGPITGLDPAASTDDKRNWMVLTGRGGYEGLYAVIHSRQWYDADVMEYRDATEALIAEGEPPPLPDVPAS